jgi:hypothetical protein
MARRDLFLVVILAAACTSGARAGDQPAADARLADNISIAHCLDVISKGGKRDPNRCPGFLIEPLKEALQTCGEAGGKLVPTASANVWQIDVNGDNKQEFTFEYEGNVDCDGAWSIFSCGSLGCPAALYENYRGEWREIAEIYADSMESIEVSRTHAAHGYRDLRVGCPGEKPCTEYWFYYWTGGQYERRRLEVRGFGVDFSGSIHGLYKLVGETALLATPAPDAKVIGHPKPEIEVAIVGTAEHADYYYVSPCNACESGFIPKSAVRVSGD